jgi:hypothetical protein
VRRGVLRAAAARSAARRSAHGVGGGRLLSPRAAAQIEALDPDSYKRPYFAGTHVFPAFPGAAASFISPVCTDVDLLEKGQAEGYNMILRLFTDAEPLPQQPPAAAAPAPAAVANLPV